MTEKDSSLVGARLVFGGKERRAADRIVYDAEVELKLGDTVVHARTENVSASGVFLSVPSLLNVGAKVTISFTLPAGPFFAECTVMRIRPGGERGPGVGLMFHELAAEHKDRLLKFCPPENPIVRLGPG